MKTGNENSPIQVGGLQNPRPPTALVLEDDLASASVYKRVLVSLGYVVRLTHTIAAARAAIRELAPDLMLVDISLPDGNGLDLMGELRNDTRGRFIVISGDASQRTIIKSIRHRAVELLHKPVSLEELKIHLSSNRKAMEAASDRVQDSEPCWTYHGDHPSLVTLRTAMSLSAERSRAHSLIDGECGVDKLAVAREVHRRGRRPGPLVVVDCQEVENSDTVVRFFGQEDPESGDILHEGYIEQAAAGTLVLDYVEHLSKQLQARLLPVFDSGQFKRVNGKDGAQATLAIVGIARDKATADVDESSLRSDFLFRLMQNTLTVPTLQQCRKDLPRIANFILQATAADLPDSYQFSESSLNLLQSQSWPHNILELRSAIKRALAATLPGHTVEISDGVSNSEQTLLNPDINAWVGSTVWEMEKELLLATLAHSSGDKERTARTLDISLKTLYNRLNSY